MAIGLRMYKLISVLFISVVLLSCGKELDLKVEGLNAVEVSIYKDHNFVKKMVFDSGCPELNKIKAWLKDNKEGWDSYLATQAVDNLFITGEGFTLNVGKDWVVLNYENTQGEYRQFIKSISSDEFKFLYEM